MSDINMAFEESSKSGMAFSEMHEVHARLREEADFSTSNFLSGSLRAEASQAELSNLGFPAHTIDFGKDGLKEQEARNELKYETPPEAANDNAPHPSPAGAARMPVPANGLVILRLAA